MIDDQFLLDIERACQAARERQAQIFKNVRVGLNDVKLWGRSDPGDPVMGDKPYVVGDRGPEIFRPGGAKPRSNESNQNQPVGAFARLLALFRRLGGGWR
jgi:hypothetical protein